MEEDAVNHPSHYNHGALECIEVVEDLRCTQANCIKYLWRCEHKGKWKEDLEKARWYAQRAVDKSLSWYHVYSPTNAYSSPATAETYENACTNFVRDIYDFLETLSETHRRALSLALFSSQPKLVVEAINTMLQQDAELGACTCCSDPCG